MVGNILRIISNAVNVFNAKEYWHTQHYPWSEVRFTKKYLKFRFSKKTKNISPVHLDLENDLILSL